MALKTTPLPLAMCLQLTLLATIFLNGCSSNDPVTPSGPGTIIITTSPENLPANWTLNGPDDQNTMGDANATLADMPIGEYSITWEPLTDYLSPDPATTTQELAPETTITFTGSYTLNNPNLAVLIIDCEPNGINSNWQLVGETQSVDMSGAEDDTLSRQMPGPYTVTWTDITGWLTPNPIQLTAVSQDTTTFTGTYTIDHAAYPVTTIDWYYGDNPIPDNFPMIIGGSSIDEQDGRLPPETMTWISNRDGVIATGVSQFSVEILSIGTHELRLLAEDSHGLVGSDALTIQIVPAPVLTPSASLTSPDWGTYDISQESSPDLVFGWEGQDSEASSGHPAFVRFLLKPTLMPDGTTYATTREQIEVNPDHYGPVGDELWSSWWPYSENPLERQISFLNLESHDFDGHLIHYAFIIQAWSETGAINTTWTYADNMAHFHIVGEK